MSKELETKEVTAQEIVKRLDEQIESVINVIKQAQQQIAEWTKILQLNSGALQALQNIRNSEGVSSIINKPESEAKDEKN